MQIISDVSPVVPDSSLASITACLGEAAAKYAQNKHRGGSNGKKGSRYEDYFLAYSVAEIVSHRLDGTIPAWPFLRGQTYGFVDDMMVSSSEANSYYQLKNVASISWTTGDHPIATDFSYQYAVASYEKQANPTTHLVVANAAQQTALQHSMPGDIAPHSTVRYFPYSESVNRLVLENESLHPVLKQLSKSKTPCADELTGVLGVLIMGCLDHPEGASVEAILKSVNRFHPNQIRLIELVEAPVILSVRFKSILDGIAGLTYDVSKGFFNWSAFGTTGVFGFSCNDPQFVQFQANVEQVQPTTFDGFEELLP
jgi:hypothetical protein